MIKYLCDVCGGEVSKDDVKQPLPESVAIIKGTHICRECVEAFESIDVEMLVRDAIITQRKDGPLELPQCPHCKHHLHNYAAYIRVERKKKTKRINA